MRHERGTGVRARRGDVDDASPTGVEHVGQHGLGHVEDPVEVDVDQPLPVRRVRRHRQSVLGDRDLTRDRGALAQLAAATPGGYRVVNQAYVNYYEKNEGRSY